MMYIKNGLKEAGLSFDIKEEAEEIVYIENDIPENEIIPEDERVKFRKRLYVSVSNRQEVTAHTYNQKNIKMA